MTNDWHFGNANNDTRHNEALIEFTEFLIGWAGDNGVTKFAFGGDLFHQRDKLNVQTINYSMVAMEMLHNHFGEFVLIPGNHDLYYKDTRDITSLQIFNRYAKLVDFYTVDEENSIMYVSWLNSQEEYDEIINVSREKNIRFIYGHFEFTKFMMNDHYQMEHGYSHKELAHVEKVFSGHYHMRQNKGNVYYTGNPFPFDFNDVNDTERGFVVLDLDTGEHEYINYNKIRVDSIDYKDFLAEDYKPVAGEENTSIRIVFGEEVDNKVLDMVKDKMQEFNFREGRVEYKSTKLKSVLESEVTIERVSGIDESVINSLKNMEPIEGIDKNLLIEIYERSREEHA